MSRSKHLKPLTPAKANDCIKKVIWNLVSDLGDLDDMTHDDCDRLLRRLTEIRWSLEQTKKRGGVVVIEEDDTLITAYRCGTFNAYYQDPKTTSQKLSSHERKFLKQLCVAEDNAEPSQISQ